jgi:DNA polymerase-3 subunit epsilon
MNPLLLTRPLIFFDLETTGADRQHDRIIQFCFLAVFPDGTEKIFTNLVKPGIPISEASIKVHGITEVKLQGSFPLSHYANEIWNLISDADLVGFGCLQFDVPLLFSELNRCGITWDYTKNNIIDACNIYKKHVPRDLASAAKYYCNGIQFKAHDAQEDVVVTKQVFFSQFLKHELPTDLKALARMSNHDRPLVDLSGKFTIDEEGDFIINFSNNKGQKAKDNISFMHWMLGKDFSADVKMICNKVIDEDDEANRLVDNLLF